MKYTTAAAFRQALEQRLKDESADTGLSLARLRKRVAFELFLRRLLTVAPDRWVLKGALALDFRLGVTTRATKDIDLGRDDDEQAATRDIAHAQQHKRQRLLKPAAPIACSADREQLDTVSYPLPIGVAGQSWSV
jgi:hypothetical protein